MCSWYGIFFFSCGYTFLFLAQWSFRFLSFSIFFTSCFFFLYFFFSVFSCLSFSSRCSFNRFYLFLLRILPKPRRWGQKLNSLESAGLLAESPYIQYYHLPASLDMFLSYTLCRRCLVWCIGATQRFYHAVLRFLTGYRWFTRNEANSCQHEYRSAWLLIYRFFGSKLAPLFALKTRIYSLLLIVQEHCH